MRDLYADGARPVREGGERLEPGVTEAQLTAAGAGRGDTAEQGGVAVTHGATQLGAQCLVGVDVAVGAGWGGQGEGVHRGAAGQGAAHDDHRGQRLAEHFEDPAVPLREQARAAVQHQRVAGQLGAQGDPGDHVGSETQPEGVGHGPYGGEHVTGGTAHAETDGNVADQRQHATARLPFTLRGAFLDGEGGGAQRLRAVGGDDGEHAGRGCEPGVRSRLAHRERDQAGATSPVLVPEDALQDLAVVTGRVPGAGADGTGCGPAGAGRHEPLAAR